LAGCLIALEGIDKSGKETQTKLLKAWLESLGYKVETIAFPDYSTPIGKEIKAFLDGSRSFTVEVRQLLYVANRWERKDDIERWINEGKIVIADRYIPSGIAYGLANGLPLDWLLCLEEGLPKANLVIVMDITVDTSFKRMGREKDRYERNRAFLERVRDSYLKLSKKFNWHVIDGEQSVNDVFSDIKKIVESFLKSHKRAFS